MKRLFSTTLIIGLLMALFLPIIKVNAQESGPITGIYARYDYGNKIVDYTLYYSRPIKTAYGSGNDGVAHTSSVSGTGSFDISLLALKESGYQLAHFVITDMNDNVYYYNAENWKDYGFEDFRVPFDFTPSNKPIFDKNFWDNKYSQKDGVYITSDDTVFIRFKSEKGTGLFAAAEKPSFYENFSSQNPINDCTRVESDTYAIGGLLVKSGEICTKELFYTFKDKGELKSDGTPANIYTFSASTPNYGGSLGTAYSLKIAHIAKKDPNIIEGVPGAVILPITIEPNLKSSKISTSTDQTEAVISTETVIPSTTINPITSNNDINNISTGAVLGESIRNVTKNPEKDYKVFFVIVPISLLLLIVGALIIYLNRTKLKLFFKK